MSETWIWIRVPLRRLLSAIGQLKAFADRQHGLARLEHHQARREALRKLADETDADAEALRLAMHRSESGEDKP